MKTPPTYLFQQLISILAIVFLLTLRNSTDAFAQFSTVINVPSTEHPSLPDDFYVGSDTQVNIHNGALVGTSFFEYEEELGPIPTNREVNISGGEIGGLFDAMDTVVNMSGGSIGAFFGIYYNSIVNVSDGRIGDFVRLYDSTFNLSGGTVKDQFRAGTGSIVNISGGTIEDIYNANSGSVTNISGGTFALGIYPESFSDLIGIDASQGSTINLFGPSFAIDGVEITGVSPITINPSDYYGLSGTLLNGSDFEYKDIFSYDSNNAPPSGVTLTVTIVPEPSSFLIAILGCGGWFCRVRTRSMS